MALARWFVSFMLVAGVTAGFFYFMQTQIATGEQLSDPVEVVRVFDATMPDIDMEVVEIIEVPKPIDKLAAAESEPPERKPNFLIPPLEVKVIDDSLLRIFHLLKTGVADFENLENSELVPLVANPPQYPQRAIQQAIEGWCLVSFTVDGLGNVVEESIVVVDAEPADIFDLSSIRAVSEFKYQPRIVDGQGVEVPNMLFLFRYDLDD